MSLTLPLNILLRHWSALRVCAFGVQLRAVGGPAEYFDPRATPGQPVLHKTGPMQAQPVEDQEHLAVGIADETRHEVRRCGTMTVALRSIPIPRILRLRALEPPLVTHPARNPAATSDRLCNACGLRV